MSEGKRGRPRDQRLDEALLEAATTVFLERGYHAASLVEIARRAGVGTPAIYRRWPNKSALGIEVIFRAALPEAIPDSGSIRADLVVFMKQRLRMYRMRLFNLVLLPLVVESTTDPALAAAVRERMLGYREPMAERIGRAVRAGQIRPGVDANRLVDNLMGTLAMPVLFSLKVPDDSEAAAIVDQVLQGARPRRRG